MARKNLVASYDMFGTDGADLGAAAVSSVVNVQNQDNGSIHISWDGTSPIGEVIVEARNGEADPWYTLDFGSTIDITGNTGNHQIVFEAFPFTDIRLQYGRTSGTGEMHARITMKQTGG